MYNSWYNFTHGIHACFQDCLPQFRSFINLQGQVGVGDVRCAGYVAWADVSERTRQNVLKYCAAARDRGMWTEATRARRSFASLLSVLSHDSSNPPRPAASPHAAPRGPPPHAPLVWPEGSSPHPSLSPATVHQPPATKAAAPAGRGRAYAPLGGAKSASMAAIAAASSPSPPSPSPAGQPTSVVGGAWEVGDARSSIN